jgi:hypothetical protein
MERNGALPVRFFRVDTMRVHHPLCTHMGIKREDSTFFATNLFFLGPELPCSLVDSEGPDVQDSGVALE